MIAAMRAADAASRPGRGPLGIEPVVEPRRVIRPEPRFEPRPVIHPMPRYEPRPVIHPQARIETRKLECDRSCPPQIVVQNHAAQEQPLPPPWKTVPWKMTNYPAPKVKIAPPHPDIRHKGLMLDFFI